MVQNYATFKISILIEYLFTNLLDNRMNRMHACLIMFEDCALCFKNIIILYQDLIIGTVFPFRYNVC